MICHKLAKSFSMAVVFAIGIVSPQLVALEDCERCQYCVEGKCTPNRQTFGHYQTSWRRWPIEAAEVAAPKKDAETRVDRSLGPGVEVPAPDSETDLAPEFPHLKKRASGTGKAPPPPSTPATESLPQEPAEMDTTLPPATEFPDGGSATDPFSDENKDNPPGDARRTKSRTNQAARTSRLGMGWIVDSEEARTASYVEEFVKSEPLRGPASVEQTVATPYSSANSGAEVEGLENGNPLRVREAALKPNSLRGELETPAARVLPAAAQIPIVTRNPLRGRR